MKRFNPNLEIGLTNKQVKQREEEGLINKEVTPKTKSYKEIVLFHTFTIFNTLNIIFAILIFFVGAYRNLMFMGVVVCNTIIGIFQEIKAKKTVDKLSLISSKKANVLRNGKWQEIEYEKVVLDDVVAYKLGDQIIADGIVEDGFCEVNESLVTGESDSIIKRKGDTLLSGSFVVSGNVLTITDKVGKDNYTAKISSGAKYVKKINSEIVLTINKVLKILSIIIIPLGILLYLRQSSVTGVSFQTSVVNTIAALIGMIPEGLVLLTSSVFAVSIVRLSRYEVLAQDLYCIESLARIDTLCLDKTGTITEGTMELYDIVPFDDYSKKDVEKILNNLSCNLNDENPTMLAIKAKYHEDNFYKEASELYPFSSATKYSGIKLDNNCYLMGAFDYLLEGDKLESALKYSTDNRVLAVVERKDIKGNLKKNTAIGLVLIRDKIRNSAINTLDYFKKQNVNIKIISGDNPVTVSNIAKRVGLSGYDKYIDTSTLETDEDIKKAVIKYNIFGRVKPEQKKTIIHMLKENGRTTAYVGDGVNDVLALKESDCSITFQNASSAARNISQIVLLNDDFASIPKIVAEGRRTINNVERSSTLFLVKTIYSLLLAIIFLFLNVTYPFVPIQLTLTSVVTIGIPSFILALEPNHERVTGHFFPKVISKSLPAAITIVANIMIIIIGKHLFHYSQMDSSTMCVLLTGITGFILLYRICKPLNLMRGALLVILIGLFFGQVLGLKNMYELANIKPFMWLNLLVLSIISYIIFNILMNIIDKYIIPKIKSK